MPHVPIPARPPMMPRRDDAIFPAGVRGELEVCSLQEHRILEGHSGLLSCVAFAPNGRLMASGSADGTALIWDALGLPVADKAIPLGANELRILWADLDAESASVALAAMRRMAQSPAPAVALIRQHLRLVPAADAKEVAVWLRDLDNDQFEARERSAIQRFGNTTKLYRWSGFRMVVNIH